MPRLVAAGVPAEMVYRDPLAALQDMAADLAEHAGAAKKDAQELLATVAGHAAIKAGQRLTAPEMHRLVADLLATQAPAICPHGDPIIIAFDAAQLDRRFKR